MANQKGNQNEKKKGIFSLFRAAMMSNSKGGCCDMKIVPKESITDECGPGCCCGAPEKQTESGDKAKK